MAVDRALMAAAIAPRATLGGLVARRRMDSPVDSAHRASWTHRTVAPPLRRHDIEREIGSRAASQHGVVTRAQLFDLGLRRGVIRRRVDEGRLLALHRGVYAVGPLLLPGARLASALLACGPGATLSHRSAAALFGMTLSPADDAPVDVAVPPCARRTRPGIRIRRLCLLADERIVHEGLATTTPLRTIVDFAGIADARDLERAIARADRERLVDEAALATLTTRYRGHAGLARLRRVLGQLGGPSLTRSEAGERFLSLIRHALSP